MKTIYLWVLMAGILFGQTKYFAPVSIDNSAGTPIRNATVIAYPAGTVANGITLTYLSGSRYYTTSAPTTQDYDFYINGVKWMTNVSWGPVPASTPALISDSLSARIFTDTTAMKASSLPVGTVLSLRKLSSTNKRGGGLFVSYSPQACYDILGDSTANGVVVFNDANGNKLVRKSAVVNQRIDVTWAGVYNDSTHSVSNNTMLATVCSLAQWYDYNVYLPAGKYLTKNGLQDDGGYYASLDIRAGQTVYGDGTETKIYSANPDSGVVIYNSADYNNSFVNIPLRERVYTVLDLEIHGGFPYAVSDPTRTTGAGGGILIRGTTAKPVYKSIVENVHFSSIKKEALKSEKNIYSFWRNLTFSNINFVAMTPISQHTEITNCYIDTSYSMIEHYAKVYDEYFTDRTTFTLNNVQGYNTKFYGFKTYGGDDIVLNDFYCFGTDTTGTSGGDQSGIFLSPNSTYVPGGIDNLTINGGRVHKMNNGVTTKTGNTHTDNIGNIKINNFQIDSCYTAGIYLDIPATGDSTDFQSFTLTNSRLFNNNTQDVSSATALEVVLFDCDKVSIYDNEIYTGNGLSDPLLLSNCDTARIYNNDLYNYADNTSNNNIWITDNSIGTVLYNNRGMNSHSALYYYQTAANSQYQRFFISDTNGVWIGREQAWHLYSAGSGDDSLMVQRYNTSGSAVGTAKRIDGD